MRVRSDEGSDTVFFGCSVDGNISSVTILMENVSMSMGESSAFDILSTDSHMVALIDESGESQSFRGTPVETDTGVDSLVTCLENLDNLRMEVTIGRKDCDLVSNFTKNTEVDTCILHFSVALRVLNFLPFSILPVLSIKLTSLTLLICSFEGCDS